jgi:hypothetical protein
VGCTIFNNHSVGGAGADAYCSPMDPPYWNDAGKGGTRYGGGVYCSGDSCATIENCAISSNRSRGGGAAGVIPDRAGKMATAATAVGAAHMGRT